MEKETWSGSDIIMDDNNQPEWIAKSVKQVRLIYGKDLTRLQSDMNQELVTLTSEHIQIENVRTYPLVDLSTIRYVGEIIYTTSYLIKVPKEDTPENK